MCIPHQLLIDQHNLHFNQKLTIVQEPTLYYFPNHSLLINNINNKPKLRLQRKLS
jgi:hypothetical protein